MYWALRRRALQNPNKTLKMRHNNVIPTGRFERKANYDQLQYVDETIEEAGTASSNLEEDSTMCETDEKTSADYYFDSYSHFGIYLI